MMEVVKVKPVAKGNLTVMVGSTVRTTVTIENNTGSDVTDTVLIVYIGTYDPTTGYMTAEWYGSLTALTISTGTSSHAIDIVVDKAGTWDVMAHLIYYHPITGDKIEEILVEEDILEVSGFIAIKELTLTEVV